MFHKSTISILCVHESAAYTTCIDNPLCNYPKFTFAQRNICAERVVLKDVRKEMTTASTTKVKNIIEKRWTFRVLTIQMCFCNKTVM